MKNKFFKLLSILLVLAIVTTTCICAMWTVSANDATYYVSASGSDSNNGSSAGNAVATIDKAVQLANAVNYDVGDTVTLKISGSVNWGGDTVNNGYSANHEIMTPHNFKLVLDADSSAQVNSATKVSVRIGGPIKVTDKVTLNFADNKYIALNGNDAEFYSKIGGTHDNTIGDGSRAKTYNKDINVRYFNLFKFFLGSTGGKTVHNGNVNVHLYGRDNAAVRVELGPSSSTTELNKAFNIYVHDNTKDLNFQGGAKLTFGANGGIQVINNKTKITSETIPDVNASKVWILHATDEKITATETLGTFNVADGYVATATSADGSRVIKSEGGKLVVPAGQYKLSFETAVAIEEYFEDFDNISKDEFLKDWSVNNLSNGSAINGKYSLEDGKVKVVGANYSLKRGSIVKNKVISSKTQYISVDVKGSDIIKETRINDDLLRHGSGISLFGRMNSDNNQAYEFKVTKNRVTLSKAAGSFGLDSNANLVVRDNTWDISDIKSKAQYVRLPNTAGENNAITFNEDHTYRMGMSIVDSADGKSAYVRIILLDLTTNTLVVDEIFKDASPYTGTGVAFTARGQSDPNSTSDTRYGASATFDNFYFSVNGFKSGDEGEFYDINIDGINDIRDLVRADEVIKDQSDDYIFIETDKNANGVIDENDLPLIGKEILNGVEPSEFNLYGQREDAAKELLNEILGTESGMKNGYYYPDLQKDEKYQVTGNVYYVSSKATGGGDGSKAKPWTLAEFNKKTISSGSAVLFERGSKFTLASNALAQKVINGNQYFYSYFVAASNVIYGAYGEGEKPQFNGTAKNYAASDVAWQKTSKENVYMLNAPEFNFATNIQDKNPINVVFNNGSSVGTRAFYSDTLYTLYKDGQFTYDGENLYLYCKKGNPSDVYSDISIARNVYGAIVPNDGSNVVIDNLSFNVFGTGAIKGLYKQSNITVSNVTLGFNGGVMNCDSTNAKYGLRYGNAIEMWHETSNFTVKNSWVYQTFDSAITPQSSASDTFDGFTVDNCLFEYNNADIEYFHSSGSDGVLKNASVTNNIFRFTSFGWGSREAEASRGIEGVLRVSLLCDSSFNMIFKGNIIDTPARVVFNMRNKLAGGSLYKFGDSIAENKYYLNPTVRNYKNAVTGYWNNSSEVSAYADNGPARPANTADEFKSSICIVDTSTPECYWHSNIID